MHTFKSVYIHTKRANGIAAFQLDFYEKHLRFQYVNYLQTNVKWANVQYQQFSNNKCTYTLYHYVLVK